MIELCKVSKEYNNNFKAVEALRNVSFRVNRESFISIVGPSGCGKTTLLKIIGGFISPSSGYALNDGVAAQEAIRKHSFGIVFQEPTLLPWRTVAENIRLPLEILYEKNVMPRIRDLIKLVGLEGFENALPNQLSAGMKTRVALARAVIFRPKVILMDEPFSNLDALSRDTMILELLRIWEEIKTTVIFVTHDISEAVFLSDRIVVLTPRPGQVKEIVKVNLPYPRNKQTRRLPEFAIITEDVREILEYSR